VKSDWVEVSAILRAGIADNPDSGQLHLLLGELSLVHGEGPAALESLRRARERGADQARVECALACGLHISGADVGECLAAYQVAVALNPQNAALKLDLSQLLFLRQDDDEANRQLQEALRIGLDDGAMLEARFYQLAHTAADPASVLQDAKERLGRGVRLKWNVLPNIERVRTERAQKADLLEIVHKGMLGEQDPAALAQVLADWPAIHASPRRRSDS
jgi:tetratricopeptide (TPR) repeat protein